jgi:hypothetical protein
MMTAQTMELRAIDGPLLPLACSVAHFSRDGVAQ